MLALGVIGTLGLCAALTLGGLALLPAAGALFGLASEPHDAIDAINQAALSGDDAAFVRHFDADAVARNAYGDFLEYVKGTEDYRTIAEALGEEEADRILREDVLPADEFVADVSAEFTVGGLDPGEVPFPGYEVRSSRVDGDEARLAIATIEEGQEVTYDLVLSRESYEGEKVWRVKQIGNIAEMLEPDGTIE